MKYGLPRGLYGIASFLLLTAGLGMAVLGANGHIEYLISDGKVIDGMAIQTAIAVGLVSGGLPLLAGALSLWRFVHCTRKAAAVRHWKQSGK